MDAKTSTELSENGANTFARSRRKRKNSEPPNARYFLSKPGATLKSPELGQEVPTEGEALIQSFRSDKVFYIVSVWKAVPHQNGGEPVITKESVPNTKME